MNSLKPGFADELLKLALYDRLLALFRLSPWIILGMLSFFLFRRTAVQTLHALRPRGTDGTGNALNALHALRTGRPDHAVGRIRRRRGRRERTRAALLVAAAVVAAITLITIDSDHPP